MTTKAKANNTQAQDAPTQDTQAEYNATMLVAHNALVERVNKLTERVDTLLIALEEPAGSGTTPARKGKAEPKLTKKAKAELRTSVSAPNSAKYTCTCGGWALSDNFKVKHEARGHTVTTIR